MMISFSPQSCQGRDNITKLDISLLIDQIADLQASFYQQNWNWYHSPDIVSSCRSPRRHYDNNSKEDLSDRAEHDVSIMSVSLFHNEYLIVVG